MRDIEIKVLRSLTKSWTNLKVLRIVEVKEASKPMWNEWPICNIDVRPALLWPQCMHQFIIELIFITNSITKISDNQHFKIYFNLFQVWFMLCV
jgi:hypothetical protein